MIDLADPRWAGLTGGYGVPYDPRPALERLAVDGNAEEAWTELWENLHHQGDIGSASYAAVCVLADLLARGVRSSDWNGYAMAATIEMQRTAPGAAPPPDWIAQAYATAWVRLAEAALKAMVEASDETLVGQLLGVLALSKGQPSLGRLASEFDDAERAEILEAAGWA